MAPEVTVTLHTGTHCIETGAKNEFRRLTTLLLESCDERDVIESGRQLELLREFIGTADFNKLRSSDERLAGISPGKCVIAWSRDGKAAVKEIHDLV
ncbi:MAG TPA: hypothetical protein PK514_10895 [Spirochaetota bacterium]|nr:hypothetical protein [Spirochaetota bacterium]